MAMHKSNCLDMRDTHSPACACWDCSSLTINRDLTLNIEWIDAQQHKNPSSGLVRTVRKIKPVSRTHSLERVEVGNG